MGQANIITRVPIRGKQGGQSDRRQEDDESRGRQCDDGSRETEEMGRQHTIGLEDEGWYHKPRNAGSL